VFLIPLDISLKLRMILVSIIIAVSKYSVTDFFRFRTEMRENMAENLI
jgi:hypothetical protein